MGAENAATAPGIGRELFANGTSKTFTGRWVAETPVALEYNGLAYAVMLASPADLEDFVLGFALSERLIDRREALSGLTIAATENGIIARAALEGLGIEALSARMRRRVAESSCGLCGVENLAALAAPLPQVAAHAPLAPAPIFTALAALPEHQRLGQETRAAHAAAYADDNGTIRLVREDVGRHNAMDKLIGALARADITPDDGFILSTARCSYEIVEKAVRAGATRLVTISLPTSLAVRRAEAAGLSLYCRARADSVIHITAANRAAPG